MPKSTPVLDAAILHRAGALSLKVHVTLRAPWTVVFGPSGSGKTTLLRALAGFVRPDSGRIEIQGAVVFDSRADLHLPPHRRHVRTAAQTARLFPHLGVEENIRYGLGTGSTPHSAGSGQIASADVLVQHVIRRLALAPLAARRPAELSGGERQRVSLARALVSAATCARPSPLLLLDEPFAGLDLPARAAMIDALLQMVSEWRIPVLSVTHDVGEAFRLGAEIIRLSAGQVTTQGPVEQVLGPERDLLIAEMRAHGDTPAPS